jgi:uncharacterized ferredoxin-like protein
MGELSMIASSSDMERKAVEDVAAMMCAAARTAPKAHGTDNLSTLVATGKDKDRLAKEMRRIAKKNDLVFFERDAGCVDTALAVVLLGQKTTQLNIPVCGFCGFKDCAENVKKGGACALSASDLGTAVCSAVGVASIHHIDNRIMFTVGRAALNLGLFEDKKVTMAYGVPLSVTGKSPFFDRK